MNEVVALLAGAPTGGKGNKRTADELGAYSVSLFSSILTSHIEHLKRKARVTKAHQSGLAPAHGDHGHDDSPYAKELQRVGIIELICRKMAQCKDLPEDELPIDDGRLTPWHHEKRGTGSGWGPKFDRLLLEGVLKHGYGNWKALHGDSVSQSVSWQLVYMYVTSVVTNE